MIAVVKNTFISIERRDLLLRSMIVIPAFQFFASFLICVLAGGMHSVTAPQYHNAYNYSTQIRCVLKQICILNW